MIVKNITKDIAQTKQIITLKQRRQYLKGPTLYLTCKPKDQNQPVKEIK